jgi:hypothetical protein
VSPRHRSGWAVTLMVLGALVLALIGLLRPRGFYPAYLAGYVFWLGLSLGPLALHMIGQVTGGRWREVIREPFLAASGVLPVQALLFIPLVIGMPSLYAWFPEASVPGVEVVDKGAYLNSGFFVLRAAVYFAVWLILTRLLIRQARLAVATPASRRLSALGLLLYALTGSLAVIDWVMSLLPSWYSTVFAAQVLVVQLLQGVCLGILVTGGLFGRRADSPGRQDRHDLGNLMLVFTLMWAYLAFSDFLTVWIADLPRETLWYRLRFEGTWWWGGPAVTLLLFVIPFAALLFRRLKRHARALVAVAAMVLIGTLINAFWVTVPSLQDSRSYRPDWQALVVPIALGAVWIGFFQLRLQRQRVTGTGGADRG